MKILLIGNGPQALSKELGKAIDSFDGIVARFNDYSIVGFEKYVGVRTDYHIMCMKYQHKLNEYHKKRFFISWKHDVTTDREVKLTQSIRIPRQDMIDSVKALNHHHPSSGVIATHYFLKEGYDVYIYGFNFMNTSHPHHYNNNGEVRGEWHDDYYEWLYFYKLMDEGKVKFFGQHEWESSPLMRNPIPCGTDENLSWYREAAHGAWYTWFGDMNKGKSFLDVGAGMCEGMKILGSFSNLVHGVENDIRLKGLHPSLMICDLDEIGDKSYDVVTCVDVIEHVPYDLKFFKDLKRIAKESIYITTPNFTRSKAGNIAHCREYTIAQFANIFRPNLLYSASPDGTVHKTLLLRKEGDGYVNHSPQGPDNSKSNEPLIFHDYVVPLETRFNNTVDGEEWGHICGIWRF